MPNPPTGISADPVLAEHGEDQAKELAKYVKDIQPRPQQIYCSPYYRCLQTATPSAEALELPIFVDHGASEWLSREQYSNPPDRK